LAGAAGSSRCWLTSLAKDALDRQSSGAGRGSSIEFEHRERLPQGSDGHQPAGVPMVNG
jgi:hypothetical protein